MDTDMFPQTTTPATTTPKTTFLSRVADFIKTGGGQTIKYERQAEPQNKDVDNMKRIIDAIAYNETRGESSPYAFTRFSGDKKLGRALGKYQVTEEELRTYGPRFLGQAIDSKKFLSSPAMQEAYMKGKVKHYASQGYQPGEIADIHRSGITNAGNPGENKYQNPSYVQSFHRAYFPQMEKSRVPSETINRPY